LDAFAVHAGGGFWGLLSVCLVSIQPERGLLVALFSGNLTTIFHAFAVRFLEALLIINLAKNHFKF
jgi:ammonia channel protein AmtB